MMKHLRRQFRNLLVGAGFLRKRENARPDSDEDQSMTLWETGADFSPCNHNGKNLAVIRSVLVAGLYPNVIGVEKSKKKALGTDMNSIHVQKKCAFIRHLSTINAFLGKSDGWCTTKSKEHQNFMYTIVRSLARVPCSYLAAQ